MKESLKYPTEQMSLTIIDTFEEQGNNAIIEVCKKQLCQIAIATNNCEKKFQPLKITVNKPAKSFISSKCKTCFSEEVLKLKQSVKKKVIRNFAKFTGKYLCQSLF